MKKYFSFIFITVLCSCKKSTSQVNTLANSSIKDSVNTAEIIEEAIPAFDSIALGINFKPKENYNQLLRSIKNKRESFKKLYEQNKNKALDSISTYFTYTMLNDIIPHWYGTSWAFEGHTNTPNQGEIACGYFVSTTLKHFGYNLNRYKLAQQGGTNEALSLQPNKKLIKYYDLSLSDLKNKLLTNFKDGLYFVGLSNHVGYVLINNNEIYFIHSSYYDNKVMIELAEQSYCFESDIYVFAELSNNKPLLKKWLFNEVIPIKQ